MYATHENESFLKEKFNLEFMKYPQMFIYNNNKDIEKYCMGEEEYDLRNKNI